MTSNPNDCATCDHRTSESDDGWCYMFREEPHVRCAKHSAFRVTHGGITTAEWALSLAIGVDLLCSIGEPEVAEEFIKYMDERNPRKCSEGDPKRATRDIESREMGR